MKIEYGFDNFAPSPSQQYAGVMGCVVEMNDGRVELAGRWSVGVGGGGGSSDLPRYGLHGHNHHGQHLIISNNEGIRR